MKFMLVDDSSTMRKVQRRTLERLGFTNIVDAEDGKQALDLLPTALPDVIITDWNMPNVNGLEFVKTVRQTDKKVPILMCTTEAEKSKVVEAIKAGINDYLIKPFTPEGLSAKIKRVAGVSPLTAGAAAE
jgi:two-component system, chemotaxis family, chemotaxis protein CheY